MQKLGILILAVVAALAVWWFASGSELLPAPAAAERSSEQVPAVAAVAEAVAAGSAASQPQADAELARTQAATSTSATPAPLTKVRGRCVDGTGNPIAGCTVGVHGFMGNEQRMDSWLRDHESEPDWNDPPKQTTGADGRFEFTFWPPPPFQFTLDIEHAQFAAMGARWGELDAGTVRDVGDVVMTTGIRVRGRVVDQAGQPLAKFRGSVHPRRPGEGHDQQLPTPVSAYGQSDETGAFACGRLLPPGPYYVSTGGRERLLEPIEGTLTATRPVEELTIVVVKKPPSQTITGRVVDDAGRPVANARVEARDANRETRTDRTGRDGTFRIEADHTMTGKLPVTLQVRAEGYEEAKPTEPIPFGSADVVLPLVRASALQVRVVDEELRPIEQFQVRVVPRDRPGGSSVDFRMRHRGPHRDGVAEVPGIGAGKWTVAVDFPKSAGRTSVLQPIEVVARTKTRIELVAARDVSRSVRVVDRSGNPLVGSAVQLCEPLGDGFDANTNRIREEQLFFSQNPNTAIVRDEGKTDATGRLVLSGPPGRTLGVAALGPGHVPAFVGDVLLDVADELVLTVDVGARLRGKIVPPEAVAELERLRGNAAARPWISLYRDDPKSKVVGQDNPLFAVASDGTFELSGLPPGSWQLLLCFWDSYESGSSSASSWMRDVTLQEGRLTEVSLDLAYLLPGTMSGTVMKNGAPAVGAVLSFYVEVPTGRNPMGLNRFARTDADGRYSVLLPRGTCSGSVSTRSGTNWLQVPIKVTAAITAGQTTTQDFAIWAGDIKVTVLDADGKPVPGVQLVGRSSSGDQVWLPRTEDLGRTRLERPVETLQLRVLPRRLTTQAGREELAEQHRKNGGTGDPLEPLWIDLGTLGVVAGQTTEVELKLPPSFDQ